ncbi:MAG: dTDP-4-dehydrorhamnose 3,5-epimerase [Fibrobacteria bacterium]|nr:dTDP-4-dehydrorhamnose 3,5-epimerase [Fibrobacteria bacterium]
MEIVKTEISGLIVLKPDVFGDTRGFFMESYNQERYAEYGITETFVQDNMSRSTKGVLRGLHYQIPYTQGKLVYVMEGEVLDVAVDIRKGSPTFGQWKGFTLTAENKKQLYIPPGFAHGFEVLSDSALFCYKCTEFYHPECDKGILWNDPTIAIEWQTKEPSLSEKDKRHSLLKDVPEEDLPRFGE